MKDPVEPPPPPPLPPLVAPKPSPLKDAISAAKKKLTPTPTPALELRLLLLQVVRKTGFKASQLLKVSRLFSGNKQFVLLLTLTARPCWSAAIDSNSVSSEF